MRDVIAHYRKFGYIVRPGHEGGTSMNVQEIVEEYLKGNGFDGLLNLDRDCGCKIEGGTLAPCMDGPQSGCEPGYKADCTSRCEHEFFQGGWHIQTLKP